MGRVRKDDGARTRLDDRVRRLRGALTELGNPSLAKAHGPILPWVIGEPAAAVSLSQRLRDEGLLVQAIRPPTVPAGTARLRITASAALTEADLDRALRAFRNALTEGT